MLLKRCSRETGEVTIREVAAEAVAAAAVAMQVLVVAVVAVVTGEVLVVETGDPRATINKAGHSRTTSSRVGKVKCFCYKKRLW
jgi:hypothetical protein